MLSRDVLNQIKDPAQTSRWYMMIPNMQDPYECIAETAELSLVELQARARQTAGAQKYYPEGKSVGALNITFYETYDFQVSRYLNRWRDLIYRSDGFYGLPVEYKRVVDAHLYYPNRNAPVLTLRYKGCWPTTQGPFTVNYDDAEGRLQVQATLSVDDVSLVSG